MKFDKEKYLNFILENDIVGFFDEPVKLSSGKYSNWYVNWRTVAEDVYLIDILSGFVLDYVSDLKLEVDTFFGVGEGATKLGLITQYKNAKKSDDYGCGVYSFSMGRGKVKDHGADKDRYYLGMPKGKTVVLEDVITTGGSLIDTVDNLLKNNVDVTASIVLTDRLEKGVYDVENKKSFYYNNVELHSLITSYEMLTALRETKNFSQDLIDKLNSEISLNGRYDFNLD